MFVMKLSLNSVTADRKSLNLSIYSFAASASGDNIILKSFAPIFANELNFAERLSNSLSRTRSCGNTSLENSNLGSSFGSGMDVRDFLYSSTAFFASEYPFTASSYLSLSKVIFPASISETVFL